jgi:hypothetical protein
MFRMKRTLGDAKVSRAWAAKALELDAYCRLDRATRGLSARDRAEIEAAIRDQRETPPTPPSSPPP